MKMYSSVLQRVRAVEEKNGIVYAKTDGKLYKTLRVLYSAIGIYTLGINLLFILGMLLVNYGNENFKYVANSLISVSVCTLLMIAGYVLSFYKFKLIAGVLSVIPEIFLIFTFGVNMKDDLGYFGYKASFYWRHFAPLTLLIIFAVWFTIIAVRERIKTEKQYKKVLENLYNMYNVAGNGDSLSTLTEEQWSEFLKNYNPKEYKKQFREQSSAPGNEEIQE